MHAPTDLPAARGHRAPGETENGPGARYKGTIAGAFPDTRPGYCGPAGTKIPRLTQKSGARFPPPAVARRRRRHACTYQKRGLSFALRISGPAPDPCPAPVKYHAIRTTPVPRAKKGMVVTQCPSWPVVSWRSSAEPRPNAGLGLRVIM